MDDMAVRYPGAAATERRLALPGPTLERLLDAERSHVGAAGVTGEPVRALTELVVERPGFRRMRHAS